MKIMIEMRGFVTICKVHVAKRDPCLTCHHYTIPTMHLLYKYRNEVQLFLLPSTSIHLSCCYTTTMPHNFCNGCSIYFSQFLVPFRHVRQLGSLQACFSFPPCFHTSYTSLYIHYLNLYITFYINLYIGMNYVKITNFTHFHFINDYAQILQPDLAIKTPNYPIDNYMSVITMATFL